MSKVAVSTVPTPDEVRRAFQEAGPLYGAKLIRNVTIGTTSTEVMHGLGGAPIGWFEMSPPVGGGPVKQSSAPNSTSLFLQCATAGIYQIVVLT